MNHFTRRMIQGTTVAATLAVVATAGAGVASGATPSTTADPAHLMSTTTSAAAPGAAPVTLTQGFELYNYSAETLDYVKVTGKLPAPPTAPVEPGQKINFEIPTSWKVWDDYTGSVYYNVMSPDGTQIGNLVINMSNAETENGGFWDYKFTNMAGGSLSSMTIPDSNQGDTFHIEDAKGSPATQQTMSAGSAEEQQAINNICESGSGKCAFSATSETDITTPTLIAWDYNSSNSASQMTAQKTVTEGVTDQWGVSVTAGAKILGIVDASVEASYSHAVSTSLSWQTGDNYDVLGYGTGYIWANTPMYEDSGTWTVTLGNTTFTLPGVSYTDPNPGPAVGYTQATACGDQPTPPMAPPIPGQPYVSPTSCPVPTAANHHA